MMNPLPPVPCRPPSWRGAASSRAVRAALTLVFAMAAWPSDAATVRSWGDADQRGDDLFQSQEGFGYEPFEDALLARGHAVLPGLSELAPSDLAAVDVFFWGTSDHVLSATEQSALFDFVSGGGLLILETDNATAEQAAANSAYAALGLGALDANESGVTSANQGSFSNVVSATTVGPLGDLRGQTWTGTPSPGVPAGGLVLGEIDGLNKWVEFSVGAGFVLGLADPYGLSTFTRETSAFYNPNNLNAYLNFIENGAPVPEPGSLLLTGVGLAGLAARRRQRRHRGA